MPIACILDFRAFFSSFFIWCRSTFSALLLPFRTFSTICISDLVTKLSQPPFLPSFAIFSTDRVCTILERRAHGIHRLARYPGDTAHIEHVH